MLGTRSSTRHNILPPPSTPGRSALKCLPRKPRIRKGTLTVISPILRFNWLLTQQGQSQAQLPFPHKILPEDHAWKYEARPTRRPTAENNRELLPATSSTLHQDCLSNLRLNSVYISTAKDKQFRVLLLYLIQAKQPRPTLLLYLDADEIQKTTSASGAKTCTNTSVTGLPRAHTLLVIFQQEVPQW